MELIKTIGIVAASVIISVAAAAMFVHPGADGKPVVSLGSAAGPDFPTQYLKWGDLAQYSFAVPLATGTTTICAIQSPNATSTLIGGAVRLDVSSTTASTVTIAKGSTATATTTLINSASVSANAQALVVAASTTVTSLSETNRTFAPNTWLNVSMTGGTGTFSPTGVCQARFEAI